MKLDIEKINYLGMPIIEEYYALAEVLKPYMYLGSNNMERKRNLYEDILDRFQPFSNIDDMGKNIKILNNTVFLQQKKIKKIPTSMPKDKIENINPKGFTLMELNIPFTMEELRKSYLTTIKKYHTDTIENVKDLKDINDAYLLYRNFLSFENYIKNQGNKAGYSSISDGEKLYLHTYEVLFGIYVDVWELDKAYETLMDILNHILVDSSIFDDKDGPLWWIKRNIRFLIIKLSGIEKYDMAISIIEKLNTCKCNDSKIVNEYDKPYNCDEYKKKCIKDLQNRIDDKRKYRIVFTYELQAMYAFKNGIITEKRYKDTKKRFAKKKQKIDISQSRLDVWLKSNKFLKLSFDQKIEYTAVDGLVPTPDTFANKNIYTTIKEQRNEYYFTFYMEPTIKSINKYIYFRLYSYIFSLEEFKDKESYLPAIINECRLFLDIYENNPIPQTSQSTSRSINEFINYLIEFSESTEDNHDEKFDNLKKPPGRWFYLNMDGGIGNPYAYAPWGEKNILRKPEMTREEVFNELKEEYRNHEYFDELINTANYFFNDLGEDLCSDKFGRNLELATEVFNLSVEEHLLHGDFSSLLATIENIASSNVLNDKKWAKEIYLKAQSNIGDYPYDLLTCAKIITKDEYINDKNWGKEVIQKVLGKLSRASDLISIADIIASPEGLNDKKWAKEIYLAAQVKTSSISDFIQIGNSLSKIDKQNNAELAKENYILAAKECESAGCLDMVAENVQTNLNDAGLIKTIKNMTPKEIIMTTVKFTVFGGVDNKESEYLINIVEDDTYYELEARSDERIEDVLRDIFRNETFMKDVLYGKWEPILKPELDVMGELDSALYINELMYEGTVYSNDYNLGEIHGRLHLASIMYFDLEEKTVRSIY